MQLPGGILIEGELRRSYRFEPMTGAVELILAESDSAATLPARVTELLTRALASLGGEESSRERVHGLCVGDRQFLMRRLAVAIDDQPFWVTAACGECGEPFDVAIRLSDLPVKPAGPGYPRAEVRTDRGAVSVRAPTGADQEVLVDLDEEAAVGELLRRLVEPAQPDADGHVLDPGELGPGDVARIERAAEELSPEVAAHAATDCPECGTANLVPISPYTALERPTETLLTEVHTLAATYHWSEREILALPRGRRQRYLRLIDRSSGMYGPDEVLEGGPG